MTIKRLHELVPDVDVLLRLEPAEIGGAILEVMNSRIDHGDPQDRRNRWHHANFVSELFQLHREAYPRARQTEIERAIMEGWQWLLSESLLAQDQDATSFGWRFVTRRGRAIKSTDDFGAYRKASALPKELLHSSIAQRAWLSFMRGEYDTAVLQAFREVEIAVREAARLAPEDIGVPLVRKAFDKHAGILRDQTATEAERDALAHLFAGAIGSYKNPHSHRAVTIDAAEAAEMIMLASHLLRIVEGRRIFT